MKPKGPPPINLPYQSSVASFAKDQGFAGNSFLGGVFKKRKEITNPAGGTGTGGVVGGGTSSPAGSGMLK